jgi:hypothetical protein
MINIVNNFISTKASFLGDSDFPRSAMKYFRGGLIRFYEIIYEQYSRLAFTRAQDRSIAIGGLEKRLIRFFDTHGGYGIFECFLHRSLLWQRDPHKEMRRIKYPSDREIPTWSWMAYDGEITYMGDMAVPFGEVEWNPKIRSPFNYQHQHDDSRHYWHTRDHKSNIGLKAVAWEYFLLAENEKQGKVIWDEPGKLETRRMKCVVVGKQKMANENDEQTHYVLVIASTDLSEECTSYERVGVGFMERRFIKFDEKSLEVEIE